MSTPIPKYLYRYTAFPADKDSDLVEKLKRLEALFVDSKVYMVSPLWFNDPYDCKTFLRVGTLSSYDRKMFVRHVIDFRPQKLTERQKKQAVEMLSRRYEDANEMELAVQFLSRGLLEMSPRSAMLSLCEKGTDTLMWSHYANGHKGMCLQIDTSLFEKATLGNLHKVQYESEYPTIKEFLYAIRHGDNASAARLFYSRKSKDWEYEREWRFIVHAERGLDQVKDQPAIFPPESLSAVIFGCEMKTENKEMVKGWISKRKTPMTICQAVRSKTQYSVEIDGLPQP